MPNLNSRIREVLAPVSAYNSDIEIVESKGSWVTDAGGKNYLDFTCGIAVTNLGHQHPDVKTAVLEQIDRLWHAGGSFRFDSKIRAAEALREVTPEGIEQFVFVNSGGEAIEAAIKMAKITTKRQGIVAFRGGFHGRTMGALSYTTSKAFYRQGYHPMVPSVFIAPFPHPYEWHMDQEEADQWALDELERIFRHDVAPKEVAAFLIEPIQGEGGYYPASSVFMHRLRQLADQHEILLIVDEVQTGFGRTGNWFAVDRLGVLPDVIVLGKAIANGFPLAAVGASTQQMAAWPSGSHGSTFGGNPISCAAAAATIKTLDKVIPRVPLLAAHASARIEEIAQQRESIGDVRGAGLMIGIELSGNDGKPDAAAMAHVKHQAIEAGMFILSCGPDSNVIRFVPPLTVNEADLDLGLDIIDQALASYED